MLHALRAASLRGIEQEPTGLDWERKAAHSREVLEMIIKALHKSGGVDYLVQCAKDNPAAFLGLIGKILPTTFSNTDGSSFTLHLLAATSVSQEMLREPRQPPTIDVKPQLRDAPLPLE